MCIFCRIVAGELPCYTIYEDVSVLAFLDISPATVGHTLVIPKQHFTSILDCDPDLLAAVAKAIQKIARHYVNNCGFTGLNILNANGKAAQQSEFHLHFHLVPRTDNDGLDFWPQTSVPELDLAAIRAKLAL